MSSPCDVTDFGMPAIELEYHSDSSFGDMPATVGTDLGSESTDPAVSINECALEIRAFLRGGRAGVLRLKAVYPSIRENYHGENTGAWVLSCQQAFLESYRCLYPEISEAIKKHLEIIPVSRMDEVIARALVRKPEPIEWDEASAKMAAAAAAPGEPPVIDEDGITAH